MVRCGDRGSLPALYPVNHPMLPTTCDALFPPPCGAGTCSIDAAADGLIPAAMTCACPAGFVHRGSLGQAARCVPEASCSKVGAAACGATASCRNLEEGDYECSCLEVSEASESCGAGCHVCLVDYGRVDGRVMSRHRGSIAIGSRPSSCNAKRGGHHHSPAPKCHFLQTEI